MATERSVSTEITDLPDEMLLQIFTNLGFEDIVRCESVCQRWMTVARDPALWKALTVQITYHGDGIKEQVPLLLSHGKYIRNLNLHCSDEFSDLNCSLMNSNPQTSLTNTYYTFDNQLKDFNNRSKNVKSLFTNCRDKYIFLKSSGVTNMPYDTSIHYTNFPVLGIQCCQSRIPYAPNIQYNGFSSLQKLTLIGVTLLNDSNRESLLRCQLSHVQLREMGLQPQYTARLLASQRDSLQSLIIYDDTFFSFDESCARQLALCPRLKHFNVTKVSLEVCDVLKSLFCSHDVNICQLINYCSAAMRIL